MSFFKDVLKGGGSLLGGIIGHNKRGTKRRLSAIDAKGKRMQREGEASFDRGVDKGQKLYDSVFTNGAIDNMMNQRTAAKKEIAEMRRDQTRGLDGKQNAAARAAFESQIRRAGQGMRNQVAANVARSGLGGGVANAQTRGVESAIAQQRVDASRNLMMTDIAMKQQGLNNYENTINAQEGEARQNLLNKLNIGIAGGQQNAEMYSAIQNMISSQKAATKNSRDGLLGGNIIPGLL